MVSVDPGDQNIATAKAHGMQDPLTSNINYMVGTSDMIADQVQEGTMEPFDVVCALEVLEHVPCVDTFVRDCSAVVKVCCLVGLCHS